MARRVAYPDRSEPLVGKIACRDNFSEMHAFKYRPR